MNDEFINCPHWGKGGRYIVDKDGKRQPVIESLEPVAVTTAATDEVAAPGDSPTADPAAAVAADPVTTTKGKRNA